MIMGYQSFGGIPISCFCVLGILQSKCCICFGFFNLTQSGRVGLVIVGNISLLDLDLHKTRLVQSRSSSTSWFRMRFIGWAHRCSALWLLMSFPRWLRHGMLAVLLHSRSTSTCVFTAASICSGTSGARRYTASFLWVAQFDVTSIMVGFIQSLISMNLSFLFRLVH